MRAIVWTAPGRVDLQESPNPRAGEADLIVRPAYTGICGTDLAVIAGRHSRAQPPTVLGHEFSAVVEWAPPGAGFVPGDPVVVEPVVSCGECHRCRRGYDNLCSSMALLGIDRDGSLADICVVPVSRTRRLPSPTLLPAGALVEPLAVVVRAIGHASLPPEGARILVVGAGPIGALAALVARSRGAEVVLVEPSVERGDLLRAQGFAVVHPDDSEAMAALSEFDAALEAAGVASAFSTCLASVRPGGTVVQLALTKQPVAFDRNALIDAEIAVVGSRIYTTEDFDAALSLIVGGIVDVMPIVSHVVSFDDAVERGFDALRSSPSAMKILIEGRCA